MNSTLKSSKAPILKRVTEQARPLTPQEDARYLLEQHLHRLVDADPQDARRALEMSQEHAPEMYLIAQYQSVRDWASSVMNSDSMHSLMVQQRQPQETQELMQSLLETTDLQSLLEQLP